MPWLRLFLFCLSVGLSFPRPLEDQQNDDTLQMLVLVFRHGQRTPADTYPNDPHVNETFSPYGWGQLTNEGKRQQYAQGQFLREKYGKFIGGTYRSDVVEAWTTDVDRTKMSMALMMAGLMPPAGDDIWNEDLLWQPIPSSHQTLSADKLLLVRGCPRYSEEMNKLLKEPAVKAQIEQYSDLYEYLTEKTGLPVSNPDDVQSIYSTLKAEEDFKLELPEWTNSVYPERMAEATKFSFILNAYNKELQKLKGGPLLQKILTDSKAKAEGKSNKKLYAYAGHDSTISNLLLAMDMWDPQIPVYNILIIIELHKMDDEYKLKVSLRNTTSDEPYLLTRPGCSEMCPLNEMINLTHDVMPGQIEKICEPKDSSYTPPKEGGP